MYREKKEIDENTKLRKLTQVQTVLELASKVLTFIREGRFPLV